MNSLKRIGSRNRTIIAHRIEHEDEVRMRDLLDQAGQFGRSGGPERKYMPPPIDFGRLHLAARCVELTYMSEDIDALVSHCSAATQLLDSAAPIEEQKLFDELGIIYSYYEPVNLHVIGMVCARADGTPERHTVLSDGQLNELFFFVPPQLQAIANQYEKASLTQKDSDDDDDDDDDDELYFDDGDDDEFAQASVQGLNNAPQLRRPVDRELHGRKLHASAGKPVKRRAPQPVKKKSLAPKPIKKLVAEGSTRKKAPRKIVKKQVDRPTNALVLRLVEPDKDPSV